jgi:hypothetical protein
MDRRCAILVYRAAKYLSPHNDYNQVLTTHKVQSDIESESRKYPVSDTYGYENSKGNARGSKGGGQVGKERPI